MLKPPINRNPTMEDQPFSGLVPRHVVRYWRDVWEKSDEWIDNAVRKYSSSVVNTKFTKNYYTVINDRRSTPL